MFDKQKEKKVGEKVHLRTSCSKCGKCVSDDAGHAKYLSRVFGKSSCDCDSNSETFETVESPLASEPFEHPELNGEFEIIEFIGSGGMGQVFKVKDPASQSVFALKVLNSDLSSDLEAVKRFESEVELASSMEHPNLVKIYSHGRTRKGAPYIVMDYVEGKTLASHIRRKTDLVSDSALTVFIETCEALEAAHRNGVLHRDIKPSNIMIGVASPDMPMIKLLDFGIAKALPSTSSEGRETCDLTSDTQVFGTPTYMCPEQCLGFKMDERSDIYSFGCVMYEVITGSPPFAGSNPIQVVVRQIRESPGGWNADVKRKHQALENVVFKCLAKEPELRYQSVSELLKDLRLIEAGKEIDLGEFERTPEVVHSRSHIFKTAAILFSQLMYLSILMTGMSSMSMLFLFFLYPCVKGFREKIAIHRLGGPVNRWSWYRSLSNLALVVSGVVLYLTVSGAFESLPEPFQYLLVANWFIHFVSLGLAFCTTIGDFISGNSPSKRPARIVAGLAVFSILLFVFAASLMPSAVRMNSYNLMRSEVSRSLLFSENFDSAFGKTALLFHPDNDAIYRNTADILVRKGQIEQAIEMVTHGIEKFPESFTLLDLRAELFSRDGNVDKAIRDATLAREIYSRREETPQERFDPTIRRPSKELVPNIYYNAGKYKDAAVAYRNYFESEADPGRDAILKLALSEYASGDNSSALEHLDSLVDRERASNGYEYRLKRAVLYEDMGLTNLAKKDYEIVEKKLDELAFLYNENKMDLEVMVERISKPFYPPSGEYLVRSFVFSRLGEKERSRKALKLSKIYGEQKSDLLPDMAKILGHPLDW